MLPEVFESSRTHFVFLLEAFTTFSPIFTARTATSKPSQMQFFKRSNSDLHFVSPAGSDYCFETDQPVDTLWGPVIEGDSLGRLSLFQLGDSEMSQVISGQ